MIKCDYISILAIGSVSLVIIYGVIAGYLEVNRQFVIEHNKDISVSLSCVDFCNKSRGETPNQCFTTSGAFKPEMYGQCN